MDPYGALRRPGEQMGTIGIRKEQDNAFKQNSEHRSNASYEYRYGEF
ncbi:hypothetical protein DSOL_4847 [Desulfosporosinus metallidurans]|uniref:Uncharacterized protein n=1 Tax=Desulfosporosinus metallidurans TaxID=1888891 RepID=A0A1Q8QHC9_9FIRM|nr:hypothetical protein DSOL_4847 [Desulfosporosinus metallidurans]